MKRTVYVVLLITLLVLTGCNRAQQTPTPQASLPADAGLPQSAAAIAAERGLTPDDVAAALKTYVPTGKYDDYVMFASGGQSGQILVIGLPSMRILKLIAVFTPESWQGWGYGSNESEEVLNGGNVGPNKIRWGDTHHPALSETAAEYDGNFLFINDKANARIAVIDLRDFETKQIIKNPNAINDHGGSFVTPNTEYVVEGPQYAAPIGFSYAAIDEYKDKYRGLISFWKFDKEKGRIDMAASFQIELPPYWQDLCDAGKLESDGWVFCNSFNTELATGAGPDGKGPQFEAGVSKNDMDYLHIINWKKAEEVYKAGKVEKINGIDVIRMQTAIDEGLLYFAPEPKSPHGVDVTPRGDYITIGGKLDPHVSVYSIAKIKAAIAAGPTEKDAYGVPVLKFDDVLQAQVELGLGPLHTVYDDQGYAYTSLFLDSAVARWSLGEPYRKDGWKLEGKLPVHYNIGHIAAAEGDTASPDGKYVVALNKWSVDRFVNVGPLLPQNFQLIDISQPGDKMQLLYDMPVGMAEPHYAQIIKADKLHAWEVYPEVGFNTIAMAKDANAVEAGQERVVRNGNQVEIWMTVVRSHFTPDRVELQKGDHVIWHLTSIERARDATHGFALSGYNINLSLEPGESNTIEFDANLPGTFTWYCTEFCSALHLEMLGYMLVKP
ncbi:Sec-dependent nitrous-oxide reductase [Candidatus Amarolinea aalborgensis]|jgi:nitrous-oxide reductase|uniref:Sec-dependent nitrous-oxide reductase n=1 Tax=Candidatus Amarolinea aalborgensis TaxID=2249329 RepID=UPI003BF9CC67